MTYQQWVDYYRKLGHSLASAQYQAKQHYGVVTPKPTNT